MKKSLPARELPKRRRKPAPKVREMETLLMMLMTQEPHCLYPPPHQDGAHFQAPDSDSPGAGPSYFNLDQQVNTPLLRGLTPRESFTGMLLSSEEPGPLNAESRAPTPSAFADTVVIDRSPQSEYGEPMEDEHRPWQPCQI
ncbi:uncharacterized protein ACWYII_020920 isoform 1-T2 [Salvelinus alpinus]